MIIGGPFIKFFSKQKILNPIRDDGPEEHIIKKIGTPTMGGLLILLGIFSGVLLWGDLTNPYSWFLIYKPKYSATSKISDSPYSS